MKTNKKYIIQIILISFALIFIIRLFFLQIINNEYKIASEKNTIQKIIEYPYRGEVYDRNNILLVYNEPIYNLKVIPKNVKNIDKKFFCKLFEISEEDFNLKLNKAKRYSKIKSSIFIKNISHQKFAEIQDYLTDFRGFIIEAKTIRGYTTSTLANSIGYLSEVDNEILKKNKYYFIGDYIGANGLEKSYEKVLRGYKGSTFKLVDVSGLQKGSYKKGKLDTPAIPGKDIKITIDIELQKYADKLMQNKIGSIVAIEPKTGEILILGSYPSYDPNIIKGKGLKKNFLLLQKNSNSPLFNRAIMATYPPGSIFKLVQALIGLQEEVIFPSTTIACNKNLVKCHFHKSPSDLYNAIKNSCNPYFYKIFRHIMNQNIANNKYEDSRIGLQKWRAYVTQFGFGKELGIDIPGEKSGFIPNSNFYDKIYGKGRWKTSTIRSLDIGQGEMLITPIQMANLVTIIANKGYYFIPHIVKEIQGKKIIYNKKINQIDKKHFIFISQAMAAATKGTARRAHLENIKICCKTGTAENPHGDDHSVFIAFAPKDDPKIAIAIYVENAGWGGRAATAIGGLVIEKYINGKISNKRKWLEKWVEDKLY